MTSAATTGAATTGAATTGAAEAVAAGAAAASPAAALRWYERAARLAPGDPVVVLALASCCLADDPDRAAALFASIPPGLRPREGWWGLAAAALARGDAAGAARALAVALARFVVPPAWEGLAAAVVRAAGAPGWCGVAPDLRVRVGPADPGLEVAACRDGRGVPLAGLAATAGRHLALHGAGAALLGSPLRLDRFRRIEGGVMAAEDGLRGWAWCPAHPDAAPQVLLRDRRGRSLTLCCTEAPPAGLVAGPFLRARGFFVPAAALAGLSRFGLRVLAAGRDLTGSPLAAPAPCPPLPRPPLPHPPEPGAPAAPGVAIVAHAATTPAAIEACVRAVLATVPAETRVVLVDAAGVAAVVDLAPLLAGRRVRLVRPRTVEGMVAALNAGMDALAGRDVVLLDPATVPGAGWLTRLTAAAAAAEEIGSLAALGNVAGAWGYPDPGGPDPGGHVGLARASGLAVLAWRAHGTRSVAVGATGGACLFVRRACWQAAGPLRPEPFAPARDGWAAFVARAAALGWRHAVAPGVFVPVALPDDACGALVGFGGPRDRDDAGEVEAGGARGRRGRRRATGVAVDVAALAPARRRLDRARWGAARAAAVGPAVLLVTHADGGGVERVVAAAAAAHQAAGRHVLLLRPGAGAGRGRAAVLSRPGGADAPALRFALPRAAAALRRTLLAEALSAIELHHLLGHHPAVAAMLPTLGAPWEVQVHDYAWVCPRIVMAHPDGGATPGPQYCGAPDLAGCEACITRHGSLLDEPIGVQALRARSAALFAGAREVRVPAADVAARLARYLPDLVPRIVPPEPEPPRVAPSSPAGGRMRVAVVGAIGPAKGVDVLLACARDAAERDLALEFVVVGPTTQDAALLAHGRVFVTGPFQPGEAEALIRAQHARLAFLPSVWPETWCFALTDAWRAGLEVVAFDLGTPAERIRRTGRGLLLPPRLPAPRINEMLLARAAVAVHL